jgi:hypothetical protein
MLVKLIVLAVLMSGSVGPQAQAQTHAQRNTDVPNGPAVWPLIKSPAQPPTGPAPKDNTAGPQNGGDSKGAPTGTDSKGEVGNKGNGSNTRGK